MNTVNCLIFCKVWRSFFKILQLLLLAAIKQERDIITETDKGSKLVAIKKDDYDLKLNNILSTNYTEIKKDPTQKIVTYLRKFLKSTLQWNEQKVNFLIPSSPVIPSIYGQPKVHKLDTPLRLLLAKKGVAFQN